MDGVDVWGDLEGVRAITETRSCSLGIRSNLSNFVDSWRVRITSEVCPPLTHFLVHFISYVGEL